MEYASGPVVHVPNPDSVVVVCGSDQVTGGVDAPLRFTGRQDHGVALIQPPGVNQVGVAGTKNGLEAHCSTYNDLPVFCDEFAQAPRDVADLAYDLTNGKGKKGLNWKDDEVFQKPYLVECTYLSNSSCESET